MLLHGLAGYAGEWAETARRLVPHHRVIVPEQRGHGRSERRPADLSRDAFVEDAAGWLEHLGLAPAAVVGQSLGGHTAFLLAARRPDLVGALAVVEATPDADPGAVETVERWLRSWPAPFGSEAEALEFFGGDTTRSRAWVGGLERHPDGTLWPSFDPGSMLRALAECERSYWDEWARVRCPVLVVRASGGSESRAYRRMAAELPQAHLVEIADAGHDLHLDQPERWLAALQRFLVDKSVPGSNMSTQNRHEL